MLDGPKIEQETCLVRYNVTLVDACMHINRASSKRGQTTT